MVFVKSKCIAGLKRSLESHHEVSLIAKLICLLVLVKSSCFFWISVSAIYVIYHMQTVKLLIMWFVQLYLLVIDTMHIAILFSLSNISFICKYVIYCIIFRLNQVNNNYCL